MSNADEPREVIPKIRLLNGDVRTLGACRTVNDIKVQTCQLYPDNLPPEVNVLSDGVPLEAESSAPTHASVVFSNRDKSSKALWEEAFAAYSECGDHTGTSKCIQELTDNHEPGFMKRAFLDAVEQSQKQFVRAFLAVKADVNIDDDIDEYDERYGYTPLIISARKGDTDIVAMLLEARADVHKANKNSTTALGWSALAGHASICTALLAAGADVNRGSDDDGYTPLARSANDGNTTTCGVLLDAGADVNAEDGMGYTALSRGASYGHLDIVTRLIAAKADVNKTDKGGWAPLLFSARKGHTAVVAALLDAAADPNQRIIKDDADYPGNFQHYTNTTLDLRGLRQLHDRKVGSSALTLSAIYGHVDTIAALLGAGADFNQMTEAERWHALHGAARTGHTAIVAQLLAAGTSVNEADNNGEAALHLATRNVHSAIVTQLLDAGASINKATNNGSTALCLAARKGRTAIVTQLLAAGASVNKANNNGSTALCLSAVNGHADIVTQLLAASASVNKANNDGSTALFFSAVNGHADIVTQLLAAGASVNEADNDGDAALYLAAHEGHTAIVTQLLAAGALVDQTNSHGTTALSAAAQDGRTEVVTLLVDARAALDSVDNDGDTVVACAACEGAKNEDMIKYLLSLDAPIGDTALVNAVKSGAVNIVKLLLSRDDSLISARVEGGKAALEWATNSLAENDGVEVREEIVDVLNEATDRNKKRKLSL